MPIDHVIVTSYCTAHQNHCSKAGLGFGPKFSAVDMAAVQTKKKAAENVFKSATTAAEEVMSANVGSTEPCSSLPKTTSIARAANRKQSKNRPKHPTSNSLMITFRHNFSVVTYIRTALAT